MSLYGNICPQIYGPPALSILHSQYCNFHPPSLLGWALRLSLESLTSPSNGPQSPLQIQSPKDSQGSLSKIDLMNSLLCLQHSVAPCHTQDKVTPLTAFKSFYLTSVRMSERERERSQVLVRRMCGKGNPRALLVGL